MGNGYKVPLGLEGWGTFKDYNDYMNWRKQAQTLRDKYEREKRASPSGSVLREGAYSLPTNLDTHAAYLRAYQGERLPKRWSEEGVIQDKMKAEAEELWVQGIQDTVRNTLKQLKLGRWQKEQKPELSISEQLKRLAEYPERNW